MSESASLPSFQALGLAAPVLQALIEAGYEAPTPIQAQSIPPLLAGQDLLGQAQTGTGKTAAFALPLLSRMDLSSHNTQVLVLAPTRELAIQVAEAFQTYARHLPGFHVLPIYGGQDYGIQLRALKRGAQVVVGTPGRVMDHMRRGTLMLDSLKALVLDEADEMLRMGFIDDVDWILTQTPPERQVALFSATMPDIIRKVAKQHLRSPQEVRIASSTTTAQTIRQRYWQVSGLHKLEALTRFLEVESFDGMLIFVRTKTATVELAERLTARGFGCEALNGDVPQAQRERVVDRLKKGQLDIVVATDVAARGLDVERISHVVNFDIPNDSESYVHRIGRTGRAGRSGEAILFVAFRERHLLRAIERATRQPIEQMHMPSASDVNQSRVNRFKQRIGEILSANDLGLFERLIDELSEEQSVEPLKIAAALARIVQGDEPFFLPEREPSHRDERPDRRDRPERSMRPERPAMNERPAARERPGHAARHEGPLRPERTERPRGADKPVSTRAIPLKDFPDVKMERYRIEVGYQHNVKPGNIVGAIANEAELDSRYIGHIEIHEDFTTIDLPDGMPKEVLNQLKKTRVCGRKIDISPLSAAPQGAPRSGAAPAAKPAPEAVVAKPTPAKREPAQQAAPEPAAAKPAAVRQEPSKAAAKPAATKSAASKPAAERSAAPAPAKRAAPKRAPAQQAAPKPAAAERIAPKRAPVKQTAAAGAPKRAVGKPAAATEPKPRPPRAVPAKASTPKSGPSASAKTAKPAPADEPRAAKRLSVKPSDAAGIAKRKPIGVAAAAARKRAPAKGKPPRKAPPKR